MEKSRTHQHLEHAEKCALGCPIGSGTKLARDSHTGLLTQTAGFWLLVKLAQGLGHGAGKIRPFSWVQAHKFDRGLTAAAPSGKPIEKRSLSNLPLVSACPRFLLLGAKTALSKSFKKNRPTGCHLCTNQNFQDVNPHKAQPWAPIGCA